MSSPALSETTENIENKERDVRSSKDYNDPSSLGGKGRLHGWRLYATQFWYDATIQRTLDSQQNTQTHVALLSV